MDQPPAPPESLTCPQVRLHGRVDDAMLAAFVEAFAAAEAHPDPIVVELTTFGGDADVDTSGGDVDVEVPTVDADIDPPDVDVEGGDLPDVDVDTGDLPDVDVQEGDAEADVQDGADRPTSSTTAG